MPSGSTVTKNDKLEMTCIVECFENFKPKYPHRCNFSNTILNKILRHRFFETLRCFETAQENS